MGPNLRGGGDRPEQVPPAARNYLRHVGGGESIRSLARQEGVHPSTILRQVRRIEERRDDPLVDAAIGALCKAGPKGAAGSGSAPPSGPKPVPGSRKGPTESPGQRPGPGADTGAVTGVNADTDADTGAHTGTGTGTRSARPGHAAPERTPVSPQAEAGPLEREARRVLRRLAESGAVLALAPEMEKAVVVRDLPEGRTVRTAITDRATAEAMALRDWLDPQPPTGKVRRYRLSATGRQALKRMLAEEAARLHPGLAEAQPGFRPGPGAPPGPDPLFHVPGGGPDPDADPSFQDGRRGAVRYGAAESPVSTLGRRRARGGAPFLEDGLILAAELLREDFELAQMAPRVTQNWERLLTGVDEGTPGSTEAGLGTGPAAARSRVAAALAELGPGLGDIALRCCCYLEGLESVERRLGWSSRSGKIVLRIALERLRRHYERRGGMNSVLIG